MTGIVASPGQRNCRDLFKTAVKRAQRLMQDPVQKAAWLKRVRQKHRLFNQLVKYFMLEAKREAKQRAAQGMYMIRTCFKNAAPVCSMQVTDTVTITQALVPGIVYLE